MILYFTFVVIVLSNFCSGQYIKETDDCIKRGVVLTPEYNITQNDIANGTCGFILQSRGIIVVQPIFMNISLNTRIRLYLLTGNTSLPFKVKVHEYYNQYSFKSFVYVGQGYHKYALVVLSKNGSNSVGDFKFLYKTNCSIDLEAEDFPEFMSPSYMPSNPALTLLMRNISSQDYLQCVYTVSSRKRVPFTVKITSLTYYWFNLYINNQYVNGLTKITFSGDQKINIAFNFYYYYWYYSWYYYNYMGGFTGAVDLAYQVLNLLPVDNVPLRGVPQISYLGINYTIQYESLTPIDAQIMCLTLGSAGVKSVKPSTNYTDRKFLSTSFQCTGAERLLLHCNDIDVQKLYYKEFYSAPKYTTLLTCTDKFRLRFSTESNAFDLVEIKYAGAWSYICPDNMDPSAADVICSEMGYESALYFDRYVGNRSANNYYNYDGDYYKYRYNTAMNNVRCNGETKLKNCYYQFSNNFWQYLFPNQNNYYYYNVNGFYYSIYRPQNNYQYYCNSGALQLKCQNNTQFSLKPGHFQGYLMYNKSMVCSDSFSQNNAAVYCRHLGYPGVRKSYTNTYISVSNYSLINLRCNGNENSPQQCTVDPYSYCSSGKPAGTICQNVALAGGSTANEGRIEVYHKGQKGLLCDDALSDVVANIVCRQLGYSFALNKSRAAGYIYGFGNKNFLLDYLYCSGYEDSIDDCYSQQWRTRNCYENDIAGVVCQGNISCGQAYTEERNQISTNGYNTTFGANPWQVRIIPSSVNEWCSGTIINRNWVLTAANCFTLPYSNFYITTSSSQYYWDSSNWAYTNSINSVFIHPQYSSITGDYNLALVKVNTLTFDANVQPACMPSGNLTSYGSNCVTTGWNHRLQTYSRPLLGKRVNIRDYNYCQSHTEFDSDKMGRYLCSENNMNSSAIFNGESGGPLICSIDGKNVVVGVVARSINGARATSIRLFTKVDSFRSWSQQIIAENS